MEMLEKPPYKQIKKQTEYLWASRKYDIMARGYQYYKVVSAHFHKTSTSSDLEHITQRIQQIAEFPYSYPGMSTAIPHMWGYIKRQVTDDERQQYESLWSLFRAHPNPPDLLAASSPLLRFLHHYANQYQIAYLQLSFQAGFSFLHQHS